MATRRKHGMITPANKNNIPGRVVTIHSKKHKIATETIRLDKLIKKANPKILIKRRLGGIGDVIMSTPLMKNLKKLLPNCKITYATDLKYADGALGDIIRHTRYVDELVAFGTVKDKDFDYSVDITTTGLNRERAGIIPPNRIDMFAEELGISVADDPIPDYEVTGEERSWAVEEILKYVPKGLTKEQTNFIAIQCRSNDARRTWPLENVDKLADLLAKNENTVVFLLDWGSTVNRWKDRTRVYSIKNQPITQTAALFEQIDVVVCPDSALLHLAGALSKKIVTIFGPIPPQSRINHYHNATAVVHHLACSFCWYTPKCSSNKNSRLECLTGITPEEVEKAVREKLGENMVAAQMITHGNTLTKARQDNIILVKRQHGGLGDVIMTTPAIEALKRKYPTKELHYAVPKEYFSVLENNPYIDKLIDVKKPINLKRYFMIMDISHQDSTYESTRVNANQKVEKNRVEIYAEALGVRSLIDSLVPKYYITKEEQLWAKDFLRQQDIDPKKPSIALQLKSAEIYRDWPEDKFPSLFKLLAPFYNLILLGHSRNNLYKDIIDAAGFPIRKWAAIMAECNGLITVDTGPLHVGAALNIPTIALFGPIDYKARCKGYKNVTAVTTEMPCSPCWRNAIIKCKQNNRVAGHSKCMENIPVKAVYKLALKKF